MTVLKNNVLTLKAVVNCASALSIQFTEMQYRPWGKKQAKEGKIESYTMELLNKTGISPCHFYIYKNNKVIMLYISVLLRSSIV